MRNKGKRWLRLAIGAMVAGAMTPAVLRWVRRAGAANRAVDMRMTLVVERPVAEVFEFCRDFANFPEIVDVLLSVEDYQDGRSHWAVRSPTGQAIEWDAVVTKYVPNSVIAWESVRNSTVQSTGLMRFSPLSVSETRLDLSLTYLPRSTNLSEAFAALLSGRNRDRIRSELVSATRALGTRTADSSDEEEARLRIPNRPDLSPADLPAEATL
ncbi:MAG TPA: SRPBCC family protein [Gemmatimonadaceae bacterium]|nr:SRPBCC family protein [Gemmatimonadaceae bacterium]